MSRVKSLLRSLFRYLTARYTKVQLLAILVLLVFAFFVSDSNIFARFSYDAKIMELNSQIKYYRKQTEDDKKQLELLHSSEDDIERFAREKYFMRKPNEDIYVVE